MKQILYIAGLALLIGLSMACAETYDSYVEGAVLTQSTTSNFTFPVKGNLAEDGGEWFGFCSVNDGNITFEVGNDDKAHISGDKQFYLLVANVKGPAEEGVWVDPTATVYIDEAERKTTFDRLIFKNIYEWVIDDTKPDVYDNCSVELFSTPGTGEQTPSLHNFEHFVRVVCDNITGFYDTTDDVQLAGIEANLYFERCD